MMNCTPDFWVISGRPLAMMATTGDVVLDPIRTAIARYSVPPAGAAVEIVRGTLGERAEVLGAAALVLGESPQVLAQRLTD